MLTWALKAISLVPQLSMVELSMVPAPPSNGNSSNAAAASPSPSTDGPGAGTSCSLQATQRATFLTQSVKKTKRTDESNLETPGKRLRNTDGGDEPQDSEDNVRTDKQPLQPPAGEDTANEDRWGVQCNGQSVFSPTSKDARDGYYLQGQVIHLHPADQPSEDGPSSLHHTAIHHQIPEAIEHTLPADATVEDIDEEEEEALVDFDPLIFIKSLPPLEQVVIERRPFILPCKTRTCPAKTLVLDLDETLVHSSLEAVPFCDFTFPVSFNNQEHMIHVRQRPHLHTFMNRVAELFEVVVFTASQKIYAEKLLNIIDPTRKLIKHRIFRDSCVIVDGNYLKDLTVLGRDLSTTLIIDNSPQAFGFQVDNGVPIESWYDDDKDEELLKMIPFLESLVNVEDVRPPIQSKFRLRELIEKAC